MGLTYPRRTQKGFNVRVLPSGCIFGNKGPSIFIDTNDPESLLATISLLNSTPFKILLSLQMAFGSFEVGVVQRTPWPRVNEDDKRSLARLARQIWECKRRVDIADETAHQFSLPRLLQQDAEASDAVEAARKVEGFQCEVDQISRRLFAMPEGEDTTSLISGAVDIDDAIESDSDEEEADIATPGGAEAELLSWAVGVAFGRFDWRLATGERQAPPAPEPFDPLPAKSPGMLPDGATPFHVHAGILVDDPGHPHDLARLVEEVLERVNAPVPNDVRRWLQKDFFAFHLQRYSKSRRKAPIYWPLATESGTYTLWIFYPTLSDQTLYRAVNDFVEPKLKQVSERASQLRSKVGGRNRAEEREFEEAESLEVELTEFRDTLLKIAKDYHPNQDDGVQITAAPLWPLFRHKPWQKVLKETWAKLEKGEYDWAHLAMSYWPERVREKCKTDKSLAIAQGCEALYVEPAPGRPTKGGRRNKSKGTE